MAQKEKVKKIADIKKQQDIVQNKGVPDKKNIRCSCGCIANQKN